MSHNYFLCELDNTQPDKAFSRTLKAGVWARQANILREVSNSISVPKSAERRGISSIPDVWARPLFFKLILFDPASSLYKAVYEEWKGLISLIVLSKIEGTYEIECTKVDFSKLTESLRNVLERLAPAAVEMGFAGEVYQWTDLAVVKLVIGDQKFPVGATSPATLVYTALDILKAQMPERNGPDEASAEWKDKVNQFMENRLQLLNRAGIDYVKVEKEGGRIVQARLVEPTDPERRAKLKTWLDWFVAKMNDTVKPTESTAPLFKCFEHWRDELKATDNQAADNQVAVNQVAVNDGDISLSGRLTQHNTDVYKYLFTPLLKTVASQERSDYYLQTNHKQYILISKKIFEDIGSDRVYGTIKRIGVESCFLSSERSGTTLNNLPLAQGMEWVKPELFFFTDTLLVRNKQGEHEDILFGHLAKYNRSAAYVLPLTEAFLQCFSNKEILEQMEPAFRKQNNAVVFSIKIPVKRGSSWQKVLLSREYRTSDSSENALIGKIKNLSDPPVLEMWPDFFDARWRKYFLFHDDARLFSFQFYNRSTPVSQKDKVIEENNRIAETDHFPDAILWKKKKDSGGDGENVGVILLDSNHHQPTPGVKWQIGIDFGTSNTNVFVKRHGQGPKKLTFEVNNLQITKTKALYRTQALYDYFIPPNMDKLELPFVSALRVYHQGQIQHVMLDYAIHFIEQPPKPNPKIISNPKWHSTDSRIAFINHLVLLVLAEAVRNGAPEVEIRASYPMALNGNETRKFRGLLRNAVENTKFDQNNFNISINNGKDKEFTESVASSHYFERELDAKKNLQAVCVDVGGGTSDIGIWSGGSIQYQASVPLAGNVIANCFRKSSSLRAVLFHKLDEQDPNKLVDLLKQNIRDENIGEPDPHFDAALNFLLRRYSSEIRVRLTRLNEDPLFEKLQFIILVEFSAIAFYAGMLLDAMRREGTPKEQKIRFSDLCWGGGAAQYIRWVDYGDPNSELASAILTAMLQHFNVENCAYKMTKAPKSEAAYGLVTDRSHFQPVNLGKNIVGEEFWLQNGSKADYIDAVDQDDYFQIVEFSVEQNTLGPRFLEFVDVLNRQLSKMDFPVKIKKSYLTAIEGNFLNTMLALQRKLKESLQKDRESSKPVEAIPPIFILEVNELLNYLIKNLE